MYQTLLGGVNGARFLWVETLARPDPVFGILAALTTMLMMAANPDSPEQMRVMLTLISSILAAIAALKFYSAAAVYWTVSNCYSAVQTGAMHYVIRGALNLEPGESRPRMVAIHGHVRV